MKTSIPWLTKLKGAGLPAVAGLMLGPLGAVLGCYLLRTRVPIELPHAPVALAELNSAYDDYNAALVQNEIYEHVVFSTNRGSNGKQFDLWEVSLEFSGKAVDVRDLQPVHASMINSPHNELGPCHALGLGLVFASDRPQGKGGLDLYVATWEQGKDSTVRPLQSLNTNFDEAYWTSLAEEQGSQDAVFASNRNGQGFDAYEVRAGESESPTIARIDVLSTPFDETAFFAWRRMSRVHLLFASNRPGGTGDFDLYCTVRTAKKGWLAPLPISYANSPHKEFRPIVLMGPNETNVLIFSSDRPGGKGGMDLYYVKFDNPCEGLY